MTKRIKMVLAASTTMALVACGDGTIGDGFYREAGAFLDEGGFGQPTMINMTAQMCNRPGAAGAGGFKGGNVTDPKVVMDPKSTPQSPVYRVYCNGQLNGKYATLIWREYVQSATELPPSSEGGLASIESGGG